MNRRDFLNLSVMTATAAALTGCGRSAEPSFISQATMPEFFLPGIAQWYATTCTECGAGCGLGVRIIGGRAKKVEGIETHPTSRGGHCLRAETTLQALYNPDRLQQPWKRNGETQSPLPGWDDPKIAWASSEPILALASSFGQSNGLWITGPLRGTTGALVVAAARATGSRIWVLDFPGTTAERMAMQMATGKPRLPYLSIADADYVVNFGGDFLSSSSSNSVEYGWQYGQFRNGKGRRHRGVLVSFCSRMNMTVSCSDRWVPVRPGTEGLIAMAVASLLGKGGGGVDAAQAAEAAGIDKDLIHRLAERLRAAKKAVAAGGFENTAYSNGVAGVAAIAALNRILSGGKHPTYEPDMLVSPKGMDVEAPADLVIRAKAAVEGLQSGKFTTVWVNDVNPAYLLPQKQLGISDALRKAHSYAFTPYVTETSLLAEWVLPTTSMLEQWGDVLVDGPSPVYGIQQPVALPMKGSRSFGDIMLAAFAASDRLKSMLPRDPKKKQPPQSVRELLAMRFQSADWLRALERGGVYKDAPLDWSECPAPPMFPPPLDPPTGASRPGGAPFWAGVPAASIGPARPTFSGKGDYVLIPYPSPVLGDGSITNRPWAPELPDPMAQGIWTTWVEINPEVCKRLGIERLDEVEVTSDNGSVRLPALPSPAVHQEAIAIPMGMGHTSFGRYAVDGNNNPRGYNPMALITPTWQAGSDEVVWAGTKVSIKKTGRKGWVTTYDWRFDKAYQHALYEV